MFVGKITCVCRELIERFARSHVSRVIWESGSRGSSPRSGAFQHAGYRIKAFLFVVNHFSFSVFGFKTATQLRRVGCNAKCPALRVGWDGAMFFEGEMKEAAN
jgi:hypothetical protein